MRAAVATCALSTIVYRVQSVAAPDASDIARAASSTDMGVTDSTFA